MDDQWFDRLLETVKNDGRDLATLSREAKLGRNYVQQMVNYGKMPKVSSLVALLNVLGSADTLYIITGRRITAQDERLLDVASQLDDAGKRALIEAFAALKATQPSPVRAPGSQGKASSTRRGS